jgi:hypothetical protein
MNDLLPLLEHSGLSQAIRNRPWPFPSIEIVHIAGMVLVYGSILVLNLRIFGRVMREEPVFEIARGVARWTSVGLAIQFISGPLLFAVSAQKYFGDASFRVKVIALVIALAHHFGVHRRIAMRAKEVTRALRASAVVSMVLWSTVILAGLGIELLA